MKKKTYLVVLALCTALAITACGTSADNKGETKSTAETQDTADKTDSAESGSDSDKNSKDTASGDTRLVSVDDVSKYITIGQYKGLTLDNSVEAVTDDMVDGRVQEELQNKAEEVTEGTVQNGDIVTINYVGTKDGVAFDGGTANNYELTIGSGTFIDGFEDQLIGKMPGETVQVKVTFPKDYQGKEVAGKDAVFETTINYIDETPKLTDKFVKEKLSDRYGYTTVKEMKKTIRDEIFKTNKTDYIWNHMIEKSKFKEIPDELINDRVDVLVNGLKAQLKASNYTLKDYLSAYGIEDETTLRDQYKSSCESTVKVFLIADAIAADKKISVTDEDVKAYFNGEDTAQYEKQYSKAYINRIVLNNLVIQEIEKNVTVK